MVKRVQLDVIDGGAGVPPEPEWKLRYSDDLDIALARETWRRVVTEMRAAEVLSVVNGHAIERLVEFRIIYEQAGRYVAEQGHLLKRARAKTGQWNLWWSVMRQAEETLRLIEAELGISPVRRSKATKAPKPAVRKPVPADEWLNPPTSALSTRNTR